MPFFVHYRVIEGNGSSAGAWGFHICTRSNNMGYVTRRLWLLAIPAEAELMPQVTEQVVVLRLERPSGRM